MPVQQRLLWFGQVEENDSLPNSPKTQFHTTYKFEGTRNKESPRLRWLDNVNEDIHVNSLALTPRRAMDLTNDEAPKWLAGGETDDDDGDDYDEDRKK